jgi:hypothetical protein
VILRHALGFALLALALSSACAAPTPPPDVRPSSTPTPNVLEGVAVYPLGDVHGDVALVLRGRPGYPTGSQTSNGELWAVPLDGSAPHLLIRFPGAPVEGPGGFTAIRRQLSADGKKLVMSVAFPQAQPFTYAYRLVLIDLVTTDAQLVATPSDPAPGYSYDLRPAMSADGDRIAFDRMASTFWTGIWSVRPDGSDTKTLCRAGSGADARGMGYFYGCYAVTGFAPDGRVGFAEVDGYSLVDNAGVIERIGYRLSSVLGVDWRASEPRLVATTSTGVVTSDAHGAGQRVLVGPGPFPYQFEPRWRPGRDDVLLREGTAPNSHLAVITPTGTVVLAAGQPRPESRCPARAEWSPDGTKIVYLADCIADPFTIRVIDVGEPVSRASADRLLAQLPDGRAGWKPIDLAVVRYP